MSVIKFLIPCLLLFSCQRINLFEKVKPIPGHEWKSTFKPSFTFEIKDTTASYELFIIFRHTEKYSYNNIWMNIHVESPDKVKQTILQELPLATNERGWLGTGIDDIYEHRIKLSAGEIRFNNAGIYKFTLQHIMRQDPLEHVMNAGLRIEKK